MQRSSFDAPRVFVSHSSADAADAHALVRALEAAGLPCWIAPRDVRGGKPFVDEIMDGIRVCPVFVLLHTPRSDASLHVMRELTQAAGTGRRLLVVRLGQFSASDAMRYYLDPVQAMVCDRIDDTRTIDSLTARLQQLVAEAGLPVPPLSLPSLPPPPPRPPSPRRTVVVAAAASLLAAAALPGWLMLRQRLAHRSRGDDAAPVLIEGDAPLVPGTFPDPTTAFPRIPSRETVAGYTPPVRGTDVTVEYVNDTGSPLTLLLFDCGLYHSGNVPWQEFPLAADRQPKHVDSFFVGKGWFLAGVVDQQGGFHYLGDARLFERTWTRLTIVRDARGFAWQVEEGR